MTQPDLFGTAAPATRQPAKCDLPLLLAASADHYRAGNAPATARAHQFECWYFHGNGDPCFGGNADDRVLNTNGAAFAFYSSKWEAERDGMRRAIFTSEAAALDAGRPLAPRDALLSAIRPAGLL
jgi:hypothetical protein